VAENAESGIELVQPVNGSLKLGAAGRWRGCGSGNGSRGGGKRSWREIGEKLSTGALMSMGTYACGMGTRVGSGKELTSVRAGGGGGASGGRSSIGGGGGGGSKVVVSTSRISRSGTVLSIVYRRAIPSTASRMAEAAMPVMVDLKFKFQLSRKRLGFWGRVLTADDADERR